MDEVVMISEEMELRAESDTEMLEEMGETGRNNIDNNNKKGGSSRGVVTWEKLLPRMMLRVLLVEADDSTRHIITALLRKCGYRVSAVPDGLKAWEILKGRPRNIDLILTEVDLPSISGFPLLTLIMEHEICKNIPVIMMSSQDSIRTVYQCMLRGAADYLVKPIRRNELRNLWQHVWRRQSLTFGVNGAQDESVAKQKVEATSEDNAASSRSSGHMACNQRNNEHTEKGSDAQSSCTKPEFEAESAPKENMQEFSQPKWGKAIPSDTELQKDEVYIHLGQKLNMQESEASGSVVDACKDDNKTTLGKDVQPGHQRKDADIGNEACDNNIVLTNSSREAIDLIGAFHDYPNCSSKGVGEFDSSPQLDLSLRRSYPSGFWNEYSEEKRTLRHSNASAFTLYTNRPLQPPQPTVGNVCDQQKESNISTCHNSHTPTITPTTERSIDSLATGQSKESEIATSCSQQRVFPVPVQVEGVRVNNLCRGYGSVLPPVFFTQSGPPPMPSPSSVAEQEPSFRMHTFYQSNLENNNFEQMYEPLSQNANSAASQTTHNQEHKLDSLEERGHISPATDQSETSSLCNGVASHHNSTGYGSNSNVDRVAVGRAASESMNEEGLLTQTGSCHRSILREAALNKFRLKRKERCYEKKVRYESRKKLAEQRPRVKGQFVRHMQTDSQHAEANGNSFSGWLFNV